MVGTSTREQLNISLSGQSALARQLREAEAATGQPRAQIARSVLAGFLEIWLQAEEARQRIIASAKQAPIDDQEAAVLIHDIGHVQPPRRVGRYEPEPDYWKVVAARRPMPMRVADHMLNVPVRDVGRPPSHPLRVTPAPDESTQEDGD